MVSVGDLGGPVAYHDHGLAEPGASGLAVAAVPAGDVPPSHGMFELECFASMSFQQAHQYFSAVWADGFPRSRHHAVSDVR